MADINKEEGNFGSFRGYSDFQDEFPMKAEYNGSLDDGIDVLLSQNSMDFGDEISFSDDEKEFELNLEDRILIDDEIDQFRLTSFDCGIDVYQLE